jgi:hypothetical protein
LNKHRLKFLRDYRTYKAGEVVDCLHHSAESTSATLVAFVLPCGKPVWVALAEYDEASALKCGHVAVEVRS